MFLDLWLPLKPFYRELDEGNLSFLNKFEEDAYQKLISGLNENCEEEVELHMIFL